MFKGEWITLGGYKAEVMGHITRNNNVYIVGKVKIGDIWVSTWWDEHANHENKDLSLMERRRGAEDLWPPSSL